jgi:membrane protein YdbS with pleckstrin-like domain
VGMKFIKKRNFVAGEELLYTPRLHWFFTVKPLILSLPFFAVLLILWIMYNSGNYDSVLMNLGLDMVGFNLLIRNIFLAGFLFVLVIFVCRIFIYINTEYGLTNKRLILKKGVIRISVAEIPTDRIESIYCVQGLLGRIFSYGTLNISGIGGKALVFYMVARPYVLRKKLINIIEKNKTVTVVYGELPREKPVAKPQPEIEKEPIYRYGTFVRVLPDSEK